MGSNDLSGVEEKLDFLSTDISKIEENLSEYFETCNSVFDSSQEKLLGFHNEFIGQNASDQFSDVEKSAIQEALQTLKTGLADVLKKHRDTHYNISKFHKSVNKTFVDDLSHLATYFPTDSDRVVADASSTGHANTANTNAPDPPPDSCLYKTADAMAKDELLTAIIIEYLIRNGHGAVAIQLAKEVGLSDEDIGLKHFCEVGELVAALKYGKLDAAKTWLKRHADKLGGKVRQMEYVLAKLDFLMQVQEYASSPASVIACMRKFVPYASEFPADFEHVMGSLVFLGKSLESTPYADLSLDPSSLKHSITSKTTDDAGNVAMEDPSAGGVAFPLLPLIGLSEETNYGGGLGPAFVRAAHLFGTVACGQLGLSSIDPLRTAFASGLRVLPKLNSLQQAMQQFNKYVPDSSDTLPVSVELDSIAHRHNLFHCPVIKEMTTLTNMPVRLTCGHAISKDAFNSLASSDRRFVSRKVKCPYCPVDTYKNQVLNLYF